MNLPCIFCVAYLGDWLSQIFPFMKVQAARDEMQWGEEGPPPLLVKIAPDLSKEDLEDIAAVSMCILLPFSYFHILSLYNSFRIDYRLPWLFTWMDWYLFAPLLISISCHWMNLKLLILQSLLHLLYLFIVSRLYQTQPFQDQILSVKVHWLQKLVAWVGSLSSISLLKSWRRCISWQG